MPDFSSSSLIGQTISHYRIIEKLGAGGMGVVYKAEDSRLGRFVALKFLPPGVERNANALARFRQEAQAASALNHPNICTVHDIGEQDGQRFIAMEFLEGQTLKARVGSRPLPLSTFLDWALQISDALSAAHTRGIVHRDVKPANIFITTRDEIKLADFGLAKRLPLEESGPEGLPTISGPFTVQGQIVGTLAYMSPEQMQGGDIDARSDIFSFGAVMYEMSTGRPAFHGTSPAILIAEIVRGESKPVRDINPAAPEELQRIIGKSLEKDRADRYQTAGELMVDLRRLKRAELGSSETSRKTKMPPASPWLRAKSFWIVGLAAVALIAFLIVALSAPAPVSGPLESQQITFSNETKGLPIVTDGSRLYFQSNGNAVEMSVKGGPVVPLRASLSGMRIMDISPDASELLAWKPDLNDETNRGSLWTVPVLGGTPNGLGNQLARGASWSLDGRSIVYADLTSVLVGDSNGANVKQIWDAHRTVWGGPRFSPDSKRIRVTVAGASLLDPTRIWEVDVDGGNPHDLALPWPDDAYQNDGQWTPDGRHFFFSSNREDLNGIYELKQRRWFELWKKPTAVRLTAGQIDVLGATPSRDSTGLFVVGRIPQGTMLVYDSTQKRFVPFLEGLSAAALIVSPDRKWMVYSDYPRHFLWRSKLDGSEKLQLTSLYSWMPQWSPDSKWIAFSNHKEIYRVSVDGGAPEKLTSEGKNEVAPSWSPDGQSIAFNDFPSPGRVVGVKVVDLATRKVSIMPGSEGFYVPSWSPDGEHMVAIAENPLRMVLYSPRDRTWKDLKKFEAPWGFWVWSSDSKSVYMALTLASPGEDLGIYRLTIPNGTWERIAKYSGLTASSDGFEGFPCITPNGQIAMMSDTSATQIYFAKWSTSTDPP